MKRYLQTPLGIMFILNLFTQRHLSYILFKCEHIFAGQNKNLDILFETTPDYHQAAALLQQQGFIVRLSERVEKYKTMYCGLIDGTMCSIHLHREIAWHGMIALDKKEVFLRKRVLAPLIVVPGVEDSILIHSAHVLFENFKITEKEEKYLSQAYAQNIDKKYIFQQLQQHHWRYGFRKVLAHLPSGNSLPKTTLAAAWIHKLKLEPLTALYLSKKMAKKVVRTAFPRRKGCLISFCGINGSGKTTLAKTVFTAYQPLASHWGINSHYYYFGWEPEFALTKIISSILKRKNKKVFQEVNLKPAAVPSFSLFQELLLWYIFMEFYYRYRKNILPKLKQKDIIITDRYFYDIFGQYPYAQNSQIMKRLLYFFPPPDFTYILDAEIDQIISREKTDRKDHQKITALERTILPRKYLLQQQQNYRLLLSLLPAKMMKTNKSQAALAQSIVQQTWRGVI